MHYTKARSSLLSCQVRLLRSTTPACLRLEDVGNVSLDEYHFVLGNCDIVQNMR